MHCILDDNELRLNLNLGKSKISSFSVMHDKTSKTSKGDRRGITSTVDPTATQVSMRLWANHVDPTGKRLIFLRGGLSAVIDFTGSPAVRWILAQGTPTVQSARIVHRVIGRPRRFIAESTSDLHKFVLFILR
jgi:hypothetical protein